MSFTKFLVLNFGQNILLLYYADIFIWYLGNSKQVVLISISSMLFTLTKRMLFSKILRFKLVTYIENTSISSTKRPATALAALSKDLYFFFRFAVSCGLIIIKTNPFFSFLDSIKHLVVLLGRAGGLRPLLLHRQRTVRGM